MRSASLLAAAALLAATAPAHAQQYVLRLESRAQRASYRGIALDSVPVGQVVTGATGGPETADGYAVSCAPGATFCEFYRPGPERRGGPLVIGATLTAWGFGVPGLSVHGNARLGLDLGGADVWPGTDPALQLLEGYVQYANAWLTGRAGRQVVRGRLGYSGFDGGFVAAHHEATGLEGELYLGIGLARGVALPVTAPALNPLDNFQPREHQLVAGANGGWRFSAGDVRVEYQREVDRDTRNFVSERVALSASVRPLIGWRVSGGAEYDIARGWWGTADAQVAYSQRRWGASAGVRRYRPYFDLWTIWGVFSPVPFTSLSGSFWVTPVANVDLQGSAERYWYADPEASTPLLPEEQNGWRWGARAGVAFAEHWYAGGDYRVEFGPAASSRGWGLDLSWQPISWIGLAASGGRQIRPLEFRYNESALTWIGLRADARPTERLGFSLSATHYAEDRNRPDAAAFSWNQTRLVGSVSWLIGSGADRPALPPVRRPGAY